MTLPTQETARIAVIGLGYVGLPLAVAFGRTRSVTGFDINQNRIAELRSGEDHTLEVSPENLAAARHLSFTSDPGELAQANVYIITVPTPVDVHRRPDLTPLIKASTTVGQVLSPGDVVIYESTVYPGCTEEECVPVLEQASGLQFNQDFFCGYSPERMNPGDKEHTVETIVKVTSGSTPEAGRFVDQLYRSVVRAGTHLAPTMQVAEAAKVIENAQRDLNIAFVNELALLFRKLNLDTLDVLEAAGTKWNFLPFRPGLVGGHCIGVDPYYLAYKAQAIGYHPELILAGRRLNDGMGAYAASQVVKQMIRKGLVVAGAPVLVLGVTFKENCPDIRNSRVVDLVRELEDYQCRVEVCDPQADPGEVRAEYGFPLLQEIPRGRTYAAVVVAVAHQEFASLDVRALAGGEAGVVYDLKGILDRSVVDERL
ncbi:Vi polysaccharide biosynthesis protein VipA/TviB [Alkalispirochaeta sphaeroplastigenens]|uniref:Vi polysaccharide biosynthesis protein VipA/TviB n=1 Tax=Alkalispirochaeta sphaeroplastigenens TaxID=1187066 RepID=A0A2S4JFX2_9SPIO|nr:nucleotide sugar dehydrogenase [Alkalispirochaeta sphaeroplastigenens]POQ98389.1 Vi polysaccharide biosynthesis protein VipA/TviB [Alkalispirochaeta sphaeroplastigenens]